ncbi:hypothetical protein [Corynebacterium guangdongense]|uniref:Uncharacterized protein n=1 Tax=Corynebacterium guangdongense TaxID=1783348 RepID=A0ABU1ZVD6_9CORY|nr:hypothetical protein [Corynebacterium guangdongense]MDR7328875.1 hypothetical protein [Corynebacterium guangdongense]WJZ17450.1 hypothetical protein CGUA_04300 [Corynebacterium guangdongense]
MKFFDRLFGRTPSPELAKVPVGDIPTLELARLAVRLAQDLLIVTVSPAAAGPLADAARTARPLRLTSGQARPVTFVPVSTPTRPVLDPRLGWIIPLVDGVADVAAEPGDYEITEWLAVVVE